MNMFFADAVFAPARYNLAKLSKRPRGSSPVILPGIEDRHATVLSYQRVLNSMLSALAQQVRTEIIPLYASEIAQTRAQRRLTDAPERSWFTRLRALATRLAGISDDMVERILGTEAHWHTDQFTAIAKRNLGVDLTSVVQSSDVDDLLRLAAARNASLISSLSEETVKRVEQTVLLNFTQGNSVKTLRRQLTNQFRIEQNRAALIAYDQTSKLNADLNEYRHLQAGITEYVWTTSHDERVRPRHAAIDGNTYQYGKPTPAEDGLPPGKPIRCRCIGRAVVRF